LITGLNLIIKIVMGFFSVNRFGFLIMIAAMANSGCAPMFRIPMTPGDARLGELSAVHPDLLELPVPKEKVVVAVYQFRDQTGQYKLSEMGTSWSTAVTQGATSILIKSLEESGWFVPIEREGLSNLLNERRIIRSSREQFGDNQGGNLLPPLLFGGITLEGGIISYETNVVTGGAGLRYFGAGISGEYREDKVSVYLRAVSTSNGRILKTVHSSKTILSQKLNTGIFRFVSLTRILEAETGYTYNEPSHMAVQEAIDKAVHAMIMEGIIDGLWLPAEPEDIFHPSVARYLEEKEMNYATDYLGFQFSNRTHGNTSFGLALSAMKYDGDYEGGMVYPGLDFSIGFFQARPFSVRWTSGLSRLEVKQAFHANILYSGLDFKYRFLNYYRGSPYLQAGGGLLNYTENMPPGMPLDFGTNLMPYASFSIGYEWLTTAGNGISISLANRQLLKDNIDGLVHGRYNDRILSVNVGVSFFLGGSKRVSSR
jgi:curli production assembly/transport component CsgG